SQLPSTRNAKAAFGVSRNAAQEIYDRLGNDGLVLARRGSGTYVADLLPAGLHPTPKLPSSVPDPRLNDFWLSGRAASWIGFWQEPASADGPGLLRIDLRPALIDPAQFPFALFRQVMARQLRRLETRPASSKSPQGNQGNFHLRQAIANHIAHTRAVACGADEILVTSGAQQAFDLIARALVKSGETRVAIEDPGYPPMRVPFAAAGAQLVPVRVDKDGLVVEEIPPGTNIICVCPSHQFPLGMSMSPARRRALLQFASRTGAIIVEDDYDGEFRLAGSPLEALRGSSSSDQVFYIGSFSKCLLPSLRLGFIVAPRWALETLVAIKNSLDWHCSIPVQLAVSSFIADGHLGRHVQRLRRLYRERRSHLLELFRDFDGLLEPISSSYGMHVATFANGIDCGRVSDALARRDIHIHALERYYLGPVTREGFVLGYASADVGKLSTAMAALAEEIGVPLLEKPDSEETRTR
ncbi:MAG TPA: PLP-dependent aminotransferase family protein, partial [Sphingomicrobium sp.]|nr:PLP-dependent aminotransferase family protein [Sphingomicrobium sp.]